MPASASKTTLPSMEIMPSVGVSRPAIIRSVVVFPQPEGPSRVMNELDSIFRFRLSTATNLPKRLDTFFRMISGISATHSLIN